VQQSQFPVKLALLHHYNEKSIVDSGEDSGEEESNGDDYDNEGKNVANKDNIDCEDCEDSGVVEMNSTPTTFSLHKYIPMQDRTLFSNVVSKKTKRVYRMGLSEKEKEAFRKQSRIKDRDGKRAERVAISEEKEKPIRTGQRTPFEYAGQTPDLK
jgi:hypothetical protein